MGTGWGYQKMSFWQKRTGLIIFEQILRISTNYTPLKIGVVWGTQKIGKMGGNGVGCLNIGKTGWPMGRGGDVEKFLNQCERWVGSYIDH